MELPQASFPTRKAMLYTIRRIDLWSLARIAFFIFAVSGFVLGLLWGGLLWVLSSAVGSIVPAEFRPPEIPGGMVLVLAFVLAPVYGVLGSAGTALAAAIYNLASNLTGGMEIELAPKESSVPTASDTPERDADAGGR